MHNLDDTQVLTVFHASPHVVVAPDYEQCRIHRVNHENGDLGLWFALTTMWIGGFGRCLYTFDLNLEANEFELIPLAELVGWARDPDFDYVAKRTELMYRGVGMIFIVEESGNVDMGVVLDFRAIEKFGPALP